MTTTSPIVERILKQTRPISVSNCQAFTGYLNEKGYGRLSVGGKLMYAHRAIMEGILGRPLGRGEIVMHLCDNPACVNPKHLRVGTVQENNHDRNAKGKLVCGYRNWRKKLDEKSVIEILIGIRMGQGTIKLANRFKVSESAIRHIKNGTTWSKVKLPPKDKPDFDPWEDENL